MFLLAFGLAIWRLYRLFAYDHGPADILGRLRLLLGVRYNERNQPYGTNTISEALLCHWCAPIWYAAGLYALHYFVPAVADHLIYILAGAAGATLLEVFRGARL